ncbi:hypothetical protein B0T16DRAFT_234028 [Cercophora newfieldiana]|uniref:Uncharacterized protein n=1 Tax=Cercophora newfieldiana TaxID=92897 RepID=A0AA39XT29_9PEZI|nr:hypothetical protein B0T16DRAFT_234028 [Cercophora newfieldiana]
MPCCFSRPQCSVLSALVANIGLVLQGQPRREGPPDPSSERGASTSEPSVSELRSATSSPFAEHGRRSGEPDFLPDGTAESLAESCCQSPITLHRREIIIKFQSGQCNMDLQHPATPSPIEGAWSEAMAPQGQAHVVGLDRERGPGKPNATKPLWYQPGVIRAETANRILSQQHANFLLVMGRRRSPTI